MCLQPVQILNPNKYVSTKYRDRFMISVPCGKCAECQSNKSNEWLYRSLYEFEDCYSNGGFAYFDTLTYSNEYLPHLSDYDPQLPPYPCFRSKDLQDFFKRLRTNLDRAGFFVKIRYMVTTEYGERTHRPHAHLLCYVVGEISPLIFSTYVSEAWYLGRTDGFPYRSAHYVNTHNTLKNCSLAERLSAAMYVTKYIQKDCLFQSVLDKRITRCMDILCSSDLHNIRSNSVEYRRYLQKLRGMVNQFHLQSLHYGESALQDMDLNRVMHDGYLVMPHPKAIKLLLAVPMYYRRKLYYTRYKVNGAISWQLNADGIEYRRRRNQTAMDLFKSRLDCACITLNKHYDTARLADYVFNSRGRFKADLPESTLDQRWNDLNYFPYLTPTDKANVGCGIATTYIGNCKQGYLPLFQYVRISDFIEKNVIIDHDLENQLTELQSVFSEISKGKQEVFSLNQRLSSLYKTLYPQ